MAAVGGDAAGDDSQSETLLYEEQLRGVRAVVKDETGKVVQYVKMGCQGQMRVTTGGNFILEETGCCCCATAINIPCSAVGEMSVGTSFSDSNVYFSPCSCGSCSGEVLTVRGTYRGTQFAMGIVSVSADELQQKISKARMWCDAQPDGASPGGIGQGFRATAQTRNMGGAGAAAASQGK